MDAIKTRRDITSSIEASPRPSPKGEGDESESNSIS